MNSDYFFIREKVETLLKSKTVDERLYVIYMWVKQSHIEKRHFLRLTKIVVENPLADKAWMIDRYFD